MFAPLPGWHTRWAALSCRPDAYRLLLTTSFGFATLTVMSGKDKLIAEMEQVARTMVQGSLSELTRQCGDPSCACASDPACRHGPHLYLKFSAEGKALSVYVPAEQAETIKDAHRAWLRFQEIGTQIAAENRARLLRELQREKQAAKSQKDKARRKRS